MHFQITFDTQLKIDLRGDFTIDVCFMSLVEIRQAKFVGSTEQVIQTSHQDGVRCFHSER